MVKEGVREYLVPKWIKQRTNGI